MGSIPPHRSKKGAVLMDGTKKGANGLVVVISGPSGVGKTTITHDLIERLDAVFSVSATTRPKTDADVEGEDYYFLNVAEFEGRIEAGEFLEYAQVFDHYYGTPRSPVVAARDAGQLVILEIDVQGALQIRETLPDAFMIFILPPSEQILLDRLRHRDREDEKVIARRFREAQREMQSAQASGAYDVFVTNEDLATACNEAAAAINAALAANPA